MKTLEKKRAEDQLKQMIVEKGRCNDGDGTLKFIRIRVTMKQLLLTQEDEPSQVSTFSQRADDFLLQNPKGLVRVTTPT